LTLSRQARDKHQESWGKGAFVVFAQGAVETLWHCGAGGTLLSSEADVDGGSDSFEYPLRSMLV